MKLVFINRIEQLIAFFYAIGGKGADVSSDGQRLPPPTATRNTQGVSHERVAWPLEVREGDRGGIEYGPPAYSLTR